jgi:hypothetical protein
MGRFVGATDKVANADSSPREATEPELSRKFSWWWKRPLAFHYTPYPVYVLRWEKKVLWFKFINNDTGELIDSEHHIDTEDFGFMHPVLPSIVPTENDLAQDLTVGLLFINQKLMSEEMAADAALALVGPEEKWPRTAATNLAKVTLEELLNIPAILALIPDYLRAQIESILI